MQEADIKTVIAETIAQIQSEDGAAFKKPSTIQGWVYVTLGISTIFGAVWCAVVFLNKVGEHHKQPHHEGTAKVLQELKEQHRSDAELELTILRQTKPIETKLNTLRDDVSKIQTSVDILVEDSRERRREGR